MNLNASFFNNREAIYTQTGGTFIVNGRVDNASSQTGRMTVSAGVFDIRSRLINHSRGTFNLNGTGAVIEPMTTVTLGKPVTAGGVTVSNGSMTITGNTLTLENGAAGKPTIDVDPATKRWLISFGNGYS